jgi:hypothetical protein
MGSDQASSCQARRGQGELLLLLEGILLLNGYEVIFDLLFSTLLSRDLLVNWPFVATSRFSSLRHLIFFRSFSSLSGSTPGRP